MGKKMGMQSPPERASLSKYAIAVIGIAAAMILVAVSAAMNWRFAVSLGKSDTDGLIYGMAAIAADAFKALAPFFFFAAVRNRMWSQALASFLVWLTVTTFALVGATGHAALNRTDVAGKREVASANYQDLRADAKRAAEQLAWIPQHRPAATVEAEIASQKTQRIWTATAGCSDATSKAGREFCSNYHKLQAEHASAVEGGRLQARLDEISQKLAPISAAPKEGDPQAGVLSRITGIDVSTVQGMLVLLLVLLLEVGSGLGPYVAMSHFPDRPTRKRRPEEGANDNAVAVSETQPAAQILQFPVPRQSETAALEAAKVLETELDEPETDVGADAIAAAVAKPGFTSYPVRKEEAETDLRRILAATGGRIPSQTYLRGRWGTAKGTISKWLNSWSWVELQWNGKFTEVQQRVAA